MYSRIEPAERMTRNEAAERFPDSFILMQMESMSPSDRFGTVLFVGDDGDELFALAMRLDNPSLCGVVDGLNHRRSLGGVVVGV